MSKECHNQNPQQITFQWGIQNTVPTKWFVHPAKTQISLGIGPVWSESSLSAWRKLGSLATHWVHNEDSDQTGRMPRLIRVFAGRTVILLVLSWGGSAYLPLIRIVNLYGYKQKVIQKLLQKHFNWFYIHFWLLWLFRWDRETKSYQMISVCNSFFKRKQHVGIFLKDIQKTITKTFQLILHTLLVVIAISMR